MPLTIAEYQNFLALIGVTANKNEVACGKFLPQAAEWLCSVTPIKILDVLQEDRTHYGDSDCTIIAECNNGIGNIEIYAFLWEVKAPQCLLMEPDDNRTRYRPTKDLVKAENQLLHYYSELHANDGFRERHGILSRDMIKIGGIIIGRDHALAAERDGGDHNNLAQRSLELRRRFLYERSNIRLQTWDRIADFLKV